MAKLQVGLAAEDYQWLPDLLILDGPGDISTKSSTQFIYTNNRGDTVTVNGSGFTYSGDAATGGTMSSVVVTNGGGTLLTLDLLNDPLKNFVKSILDGDPFEAMRDLYDGADQLLGSAESDSIGGFSPGNDVIQGLDGGDWIAGDEGKDNLDGGDDGQFDILSYSQSFFDKSAKKGVVLKVKKGTVKDPWGDKDTFDNFEGYWLTKHNDKFIGGKENDEVVGLKGDDILKGGKGDYDRADYSVDADFKQGNKGIKVDLKKGKIKDGFGDTDTVKSIEAVRGTAKKDVFKGDNKSNEFDGYAGKDKYDGGKGFDLLVFFSNNFKGGGSGVVVDVSKGKVLDDGYGNTEKFKGMESFAGTKFDDVFIGSKKDDQFKGEDGNDTMTGGKGADSFVFNPPPDNLTNHDIITDFNQSQGDRMALWTHDGFPQLHEMNGGLDPAQFVANAGGNPTNANQRIVYDTSTGNLWLDPDGNASSGDQVLIVTLTNKPAITVDAFEVWI